MTSMPVPARPHPVGRVPSGVASGPALLRGLEFFWPSRRGHAYDELCR